MSGNPNTRLNQAVNMLREQLVDIGKRSTLVNAPVGKNRMKALDIEDERSDEVFKILYQRGRKMTFEAYRHGRTDIGANGDDEPIYNPFDIDQVRAEAAADRTSEAEEPLAAHHVDLLLQTRLTADALQKRLLNLFRQAELMEQEQGISVLYLALGFLEWYENESSDIARYAPLVLLPANLERSDARGRFKLALRDQDLEPNISLRAMLENDFALALPDLPDDDQWRPSEYFGQVEEAIAAQSRWRVRRNTMELSFYSFAKFLMWNDLAPENIDEETCAGSELFSNLLVGGGQNHGAVINSEENLDRRFPDLEDLVHILDADSSQTQVIAAARQGRNLVVQGPPGTGKSQTIANIIASSLKDNKSVLFVAEKRAALEVVYERLRQCGLGPLCLELHSKKVNRKHVFAQLKETLELGRPIVDDLDRSQIRQLRDDLNRLSSILHQPFENTEQTPYLVVGLLAELAESGLSRPRFTISGADRWSADEYRQRQDVVASLAQLTAQYGSEFENAWRGTRKRLTQFERNDLKIDIEICLEDLNSIGDLTQLAVAAVKFCDAETIQESLELVQQLYTLSALPTLTPELANSAELLGDPSKVLQLCKDIQELQAAKAELLKEVSENAFDVPWIQVRTEIQNRGKSLFRFFSGSYKEAIATLQSVCLTTLPSQNKDQLALIDRLLEIERLQVRIKERTAFGRNSLMKHWNGQETEVHEILPAVEWIIQHSRRLGSAEKVREQVLSTPENQDLASIAADLQKAYDKWMTSWKRVMQETELDLEAAFGAQSVNAIEIHAITERLHSWLANMDLFDSWHRLKEAGSMAEELGLQELRNRLGARELEAELAENSFAYIRAFSLWKRMCQTEPQLKQIEGSERSSKIERFKQLDQQLRTLVSQEVALQHFESLPEGSSGQIGLIRGEVNKKTRHIQLRTLLDKAGEAVLRIKPVFMMSPFSVAQFLKLGKITFDLLLIDEASQVRPADAMGSILRSRQIVVVGDEKQMPPTSFFERQVGSDELNLEEFADIQAAQAAEMESILSLCEARAMSRGMLRWHYRSKHPSLIAVSNHEFYNDSLIFPPSPINSGISVGLSFRFVEDGVYDRGRRANNAIEAQAVADAVLEHARNRSSETLGVVALSKIQSQTIMNKLEFMRTEYPELEAFCNESKTNPFFVKNLENVQGDERDVIFISIGYGKDENGYFSQSFGPVSNSGGERRLNVLFTRAKNRCLVFSSIRYSDIRVDAARHVGPRVLRRFLKFAETGDLDIPRITGGEPDSPFETAVANALQKYGFRVAGQVGSAGFRIDLAIYDPDDEGRFLLAVECDGARYHSSSWARERDRLRQAVLEQKGWKIHRIWSTDWLYNRDEEMKKLLEAIERARVEQIPVEPDSQQTETIERAHVEQNREHTPSSPLTAVKIDRVEVAPEPSAIPYQKASFTIPDDIRQHVELRDLELNELADWVARVVEVEGPVHIKVIARRLSLLWGYKSTGKAIQMAVAAAAKRAMEESMIRYSDSSSMEFFDRMNSPDISPIRDRSNSSAQVRQLKMLPPTEVQAAVLKSVEQNIAIGVDDCPVQVARLFGFKKTSPKFRALVKAQIQTLVQKHKLKKVDSELKLP